MFVSEALSVNNKGNLSIGGCDTIELVKKYGTPLYVMDEELIRKNCRMYVNAMNKYYNGHGKVLFASKAFSTMAMYKLAMEENMGIDVVSGGEMHTALKAGFPADRIYFHGNNKSTVELNYALDNDIFCFVVDNIYELQKLNKMAGEKGKRVNISFRIKPGIDAHTHDFVKTGQIDSKFGVALENGEAFEIIEVASKLENVKLIGVHCHIGSQIFDLEPFKEAAAVMMNFIIEVKNKLGIEIVELNLGGGFGIKYTEQDDPINYDEYIRAVRDVVVDIAEKNGVDMPVLVMEPGRSIVASAGITLYEVGGIKDIKGFRKYVSVDGGMGDNPRYALYKSEYDMCIANKAALPKEEVVTIAGKCCESGDLLGEGVKLQKAEPGDILAVLATGAYNYSMSSHYNRIPKPAVVMVRNGQDRLIVKRESYDDLLINDIL